MGSEVIVGGAAPRDVVVAMAVTPGGDGGAGVVWSVRPDGDRNYAGHVRGSQVRQHGKQGDRGDGDARSAGNDAQ